MSDKVFVIHKEYVFEHSDFPLGVNFNKFHPDYSAHKHDFSELVIVKNGTGINVVNGVSYRLSAGDVFVIPHGRVHEYRETDHLTLFNIYFDNKQLDLKRWDAGLLAGYHALFLIEPIYRQKDDFNSRLRLNQEQLIRIWGLVELLEQELVANDPGFRLMGMARFMEVVCLLSRYYGESTEENSLKILRVAETISHMEAHFTEPIAIDDLAKMAHMSSRNFHRVFLDATGKTPSAYLIGLRIMKAIHQLEFSDSNITEIAFACGFTDSNYFARQFRKIMNESPADFRQRIA
jgi:AraC family L-rhamnose operon transcriptional activator RhaR/AraC family L-rhamnose operon regulatory protein RhaS